jgi:hypothetical protein
MISSRRSSWLMMSPMADVVSVPDPVLAAGGMVRKPGDTDTKLSQSGGLRR